MTPRQAGGGAPSARTRGAAAPIAWAGSAWLLVAGAHAQPTLLPDDPADLRVLVAEASQRHPATVAARRTASAAHEAPSRMASLPDPNLIGGIQNLRLDDPGLDTSPMTMIVVGLAQGFPFPGKLGHREDTAEAQAVVADRNVAVTESQVAERVRRLYWKLHFAERAERLIADHERVLDTLANVANERLAVGRAAAQDVLQAQVAHSTLRAMLTERREAVRSARRALNAAVGRAPDATAPPTSEPPTERTHLDRAALVAQARAENPALASSQARVSAIERAVAEAEYERWPDFQLALTYGIRGTVPGDMTRGADVIGASLAISLPLWMGGKQNARVREQSALLEAASAIEHDVALQVESAVQRTLDAIDRLDDEIALYSREVVPQADQAFDASITDYQFARVQFVSVLANWRGVLDAKLTAERLLGERAERLAELRALVAPDGSSR